MKILTIVVTYNGEKWIKKCIKSLINSSLPCHTLVIDNSSTDATVQILKHEFPEVELIIADYNLGFGQANNIGLKYALKYKYDYIFLLNQDAWIGVDTLVEMVQILSMNSDIGILSPIHLNGTGTGLDNNFERYLSATNLLPEKFSLPEILESRAIITVPFVNAAAWLMPLKCIATVGGFDPLFFHYGEDRNLAQRVLYNNLAIAIYTGTQIVHDRDSRKINSQKAEINRQWINLLAYYSDINQNNFPYTLIKRCCRHFLHFLRYRLAGNKERGDLEQALFTRTISNYRKIAISRKKNIVRNNPNHL